MVFQYSGFCFISLIRYDEHVNKAKNVNKDSPMETESQVEWAILLKLTLTLLQQQQQQQQQIR